MSDAIEEILDQTTEAVGAIVDDALTVDDPVTATGQQIRSIIERVERLAAEQREIAQQIADVYAEAKSNGFDVKALRQIVALRKKTPEQRSEEEAMLDLYMSALGMLPH